MSGHDNEYKGSTISQLILVIPGTILVFTLLISLLAKSFSAATVEPPPAATVAKVEENIKPVAEVSVAAADAGPHVDKSGEEVVKAVCSGCHGGGLMGSPKIGDKAAWAPRIAQGYDTLVKNALNGIRSMPAKGGNTALSDAEVTNAMVHMANLGGANFKAVASKSADTATTDSAEKPAQAAAVAAPEKTATEAKPTVKSEVAPVAEEKKAEVAPVAAGKSGKEVYTATCSMCHGTGLMNAPKFGDKGQWEPRIAQGYDILVKNATNGIRAMPAKGGNASLSDAEVGAAVKYMANEAGAGF